MRNDRVRRVRPFLWIPFLVALFVLIWASNHRGTQALVQLGFLEKYVIVNEHLFGGPGFATLNLPLGENLLIFQHAGKRYYRVLNVIGGGEIYAHVDDKQINPALDIKEGTQGLDF